MYNKSKVTSSIFGVGVIAALTYIFTISSWEFVNPADITQDSVNHKNAQSISVLGSQLSHGTGGALRINGSGDWSDSKVYIDGNEISIAESDVGYVELWGIPPMSAGEKQVIINDGKGNKTETTIDVFDCGTCRLYDGCPF